jgi:hypothetical protein
MWFFKKDFRFLIDNRKSPNGHSSEGEKPRKFPTWDIFNLVGYLPFAKEKQVNNRHDEKTEKF